MAGLQSCFTRVVLRNSFLSHKNQATVLSNRGRHFLIFHTPLSRNIQFVNKLNLFTEPKTLYRFASTSVTAAEKIIKSTEELSKDATKTVKEVSTPVSSTPVSPNTVSSSPASSTPVSSAPVIDEFSLPAPPLPIDEQSGALEYIALGLKEPPFESLGLGGYWPPGIIQQMLEFLHINMDLPWWAAIAIVTLAIRTLFFPLIVKARKKTVNMNNNLPRLHYLQSKITEARASGDYYDAAQSMQELQKFLDEKKLSVLGPLIPGLAQAPVFLSMYIALKRMSAVPVESLKTGGLFWFTDLTQPDPYYLLPLITTCTLSVIIEVGAEGGSLKLIKQVWLKIIMRAIPFCILPFIINLPQSILWYWTVSNGLTLCQTIILKIPVFRKLLKIPASVKYVPLDSKKKEKKGVIAEIKEGVTTARLTRELEERETLNARTFNLAGQGPIKRTFKRNPKVEEVKVSSNKN